MSKSQQRLAFGAGAIGLLIGLFLGFLFVHTRSEFDWELFLEYMKVALSWPVVIGLLAVIIIFRFRQPISKWIENLTVKWGGLEASSQRQPLPRDRSPTGIPDEGDEHIAHLTMPPVGSDATDTLQARVAEEEQKSKDWYFMFLNMYLVYNSKRVLAWIWSHPEASLLEYYLTWGKDIPEPNERTAILNALTSYHVVNVKDEKITVTGIGGEFVNSAGISNFPGPTPMIPPSSLTIPDLTKPG